MTNPADKLRKMDEAATPAPWRVTDKVEWECDCGQCDESQQSYRDCGNPQIVSGAWSAGFGTVDCGDYAGMDNETAEITTALRNITPDVIDLLDVLDKGGFHEDVCRHIRPGIECNCKILEVRAIIDRIREKLE